MIYQCYFRADQERRLFRHEPYEAFGLEPEVNPQILEHCPELADSATRLALCEYAAFLSLWRRPASDADDWIGFTSYRQLDKSHVVFDSKAQVAAHLRRYDLVAWHVWSVGRLRFAGLTGPAAQAEAAHPRLHQFTHDVLATFGEQIPAKYSTIDKVPYANYWAMSQDRFRAFMEWSWPLVQYALAIDHPYKHTPPRLAAEDKRKAVGYFVERLFIIWMIRSSLRTRWLGEVQIAPRLK